MTVANVEPGQREFVSQGIRLNCVEWGEPTSPLVLLVHGVLDHARSWDWTARELVGDGWRVVAMDLRGHGDSGWSPDGAYLTSYQVQDLADLIDHLGVPRFVLVGHSFGGTVCARYAAMFPERVEKLVLVDGFGPGPEVFAKWEAQGAVARSREWLERRRATAAKPPQVFASVEQAAASLRSTNRDLREEQAAHLARHGVNAVEGGFVWKADPRMKFFPPEDYYAETTDVWQSIACPTLAMRGTHTFVISPFDDGRCDLVADCRKVSFEDTGHWPHHKRFDEFMSELRSFLKGSELQCC